MNKKIYTKIIILTALLAGFDIAMFSEGLVNLSIVGGGLSQTLASIAIILVNALIFLGEYKYLTTSNEGKYGYNLEKLKTAFDYKDALESLKYKKSPFLVEIDKAIVDVLSMEKKYRIFQEIMEQSDKTDYKSLIELANESKEYLFNNTKRILNRISIADSGEHSGDLNAHKEYISNILDNNDKILIEFGKFLTEVSRMDDPSDTIDITQVLGDMVGSLKVLRGDEDEFERKYENGKK